MNTPTIPDWKPIDDYAPPQGAVVLTKIHDARGARNETQLKRHGRLWFFPDMSMYVYYEPTHYAVIAPAEPARI